MAAEQKSTHSTKEYCAGAWTIISDPFVSNYVEWRYFGVFPKLIKTTRKISGKPTCTGTFAEECANLLSK